MATLKVPHQVGDLGGYLKEQRESARLSLRQLASVAGVSNPYLSQIERGLRRPSAEVLQQIAKGLQISAEALFMRAGLLDESGGLEVEVALQSDVHLTARQKRVLLDIYATFRAENARAADAATDADQAAVRAAEAAHPLKSARVDVDGADDEGNQVAPKRSARKRATKSANATATGTPDGAQARASTPTGRTPRTGRATRAARSRPTS